MLAFLAREGDFFAAHDVDGGLWWRAALDEAGALHGLLRTGILVGVGGNASDLGGGAEGEEGGGWLCWSVVSEVPRVQLGVVRLSYRGAQEMRRSVPLRTL